MRLVSPAKEQPYSARSANKIKTILRFPKDHALPSPFSDPVHPVPTMAANGEGVQLATSCDSFQTHRWRVAPQLMTPASLVRPGGSSASASRPEQEQGFGSHALKASAKASGAALGRLSEAISHPAAASASALASTKKRGAYLRPYNDFCQKVRPLLPERLRNAEREKLLGAAWKKLSDDDRQKYFGAPSAGTPMPIQSRRRRGARVARGHAPTHASELGQLAAPPAPTQQLSAPLPASGQAQQLQLSVAPAQRTMSQLTSASAVTGPSRPSCSFPSFLTAAPAKLGTSTGVLMEEPGLDRRLLDCPQEILTPTLPASSATQPSHTSELLNRAAAHRTFAEDFIREHQQQQLAREEQQLQVRALERACEQQQMAREAEMTALDLAEMMEQQMTGEDAMEIAFSLGMPRVYAREGHNDGSHAR